MVGSAARQAIVDILRKMRRADEREQGMSIQEAEEEEAIGIFGSVERKMFQEEMLQQVVIGMGRLDAGDESDEVHEWAEDGEDEAAGHNQELIDIGQEPRSKREELVNPYFPIIPSSTLPESLTASQTPVMHVKFAQLPDSPSHAASFYHEAKVNLSPTLEPDPPIPRSPSPGGSAEHTPTSDYSTGDVEFDNEADEQAAVGRLSSMSLMAAVTANGVLVFCLCAQCRSLNPGPLEKETQNAFVKEVERVGKDPVYWVRREASFVLGALAKVVPVEVVELSLVRVILVK